MSNNKRYYWIKLKINFFNQDEIDFLLSQENGCEYVVLYQMLCLNTANTNGSFESIIGEMIVPYDIEKIARDCKYFKYDTVVVALELYKKLGLIYENKNEILCISNYEEMVGSETEYARKKRDYRKRLEDRQSEDIVRQEYRDKSTDNRDIDIYKKKENNKKKEKVSFDSILDELNDDDLKKCFLEFIKMRKLIKKPLTEHALKLSIKKLFSLSNDKQEMIDIVNQSIQNSWQSFYPLKEEKNDKKIFSDDFAF